MATKTKVKTYTLVFTDYEEVIKCESLKVLFLYVLKNYNESNYPETFITPEGEELEWDIETAIKYIAS